MPTTYTASAYLLNPKQVHVGNQSRHFMFNGLAFGTTGDTVLLCKIPNRATIIDGWARFGSGYTVGTFGLNVTKGKTASATTVLGNLGTLSASTGQQTFNFRGSTALAPFQVSLSDDDGIQYAVLKLVVSTAMSATSSVSIDGVIVWAMDAEG